MKKQVVKLIAPIQIIRIFIKYEHRYLLCTIPQILISSVLPLLYVYAPKLIIEKLTDGSNYNVVIKVIGIYSIILLIVNLLQIYFTNKSALYSNSFIKKLRLEIGRLVMALELKDIESASFRQIINLANNVEGITGMISLLQGIMANIITIAGFTYIIADYNTLFLLAITLSLLVKIALTYLRFKYKRKARYLSAQNDRVGNYLIRMTYFDEGSAKEIRVNNLHNWFMSKIKAFRSEMLSIQYKDFAKHTLFEIIMLIILALQSFLVLWTLSREYIADLITIADFTMLFTSVMTLTGVMSGITEQLMNYNQQVLNFEDFTKLLDISKEGNNGVIGDASRIDDNKAWYKQTLPQHAYGNVEIAFHNVTFTYPNTEKVILDDINISIRNREKLVVVGLNGAGKSTFIKLLCKFYKPIRGIITVNGIDIWTIPNRDYYKLIAAVFQDYSNFAFSIAENVTLNDDYTNAINLLQMVGLKDYIEKLPEGACTNITKQFASSGVELSGGQGQKLAIARAIYKNAPILILDEPTASLDIMAEKVIYNDFFGIAKDKTTIFISHRLAASTLADNIAVFEAGKIVEYGSHSQLMGYDGLYTAMYRKQSNPYVEKKAAKNNCPMT